MIPSARRDGYASGRLSVHSANNAARPALGQCSPKRSILLCFFCYTQARDKELNVQMQMHTTCSCQATAYVRLCASCPCRPSLSPDPPSLSLDLPAHIGATYILKTRKALEVSADNVLDLPCRLERPLDYRHLSRVTASSDHGILLKVLLGSNDIEFEHPFNKLTGELSPLSKSCLDLSDRNEIATFQRTHFLWPAHVHLMRKAYLVHLPSIHPRPRTPTPMPTCLHLFSILIRNITHNNRHQYTPTVLA